MDSILISICIPAYNALKYIAEALNSVMAQTYPNWELIVVEDGSMDGTKEIVEEFGNRAHQKVLYLRNEKNLGLPATRNLASSICRGEWIAFLDSDDVWHRDHLADLFKTAMNHPNCDLIHSGVAVFDSQTRKIIFEQSLAAETIMQFPISLFNRTYGIQPSSVMISRRLYEVTGGFNINFRCVEDLEMWFRCAKSGFKFSFSGKNTCYYRKHSEAMTSSHLEMALGTARVYDIFSEWDAVPKTLRNEYASTAWFTVAKFARRKNRTLANRSLLKSMKYNFTFKHFCYWILIRATLY